MYEVQLKKCPFCGYRRPLIITHKKYRNILYSVRCDIKNGGCGVETKRMPYKEDVVRAWNERVDR